MDYTCLNQVVPKYLLSGVFTCTSNIKERLPVWSFQDDSKTIRQGHRP